jgi:hypothetical protein
MSTLAAAAMAAAEGSGSTICRMNSSLWTSSRESTCRAACGVRRAACGVRRAACGDSVRSRAPRACVSGSKPHRDEGEASRWGELELHEILRGTPRGASLGAATAAILPARLAASSCLQSPRRAPRQGIHAHGHVHVRVSTRARTCAARPPPAPPECPPELALPPRPPRAWLRPRPRHPTYSRNGVLVPAALTTTTMATTTATPLAPT